jgi:hypothetical protein
VQHLGVLVQQLGPPAIQLEALGVDHDELGADVGRGDVQGRTRDQLRRAREQHVAVAGDAEQGVLLARVVVEEGARRELSPSGDGLDRHPLQSELGDQVHGGLLDGGTRALLLALAETGGRHVVESFTL